MKIRLKTSKLTKREGSSDEDSADTLKAIGERSWIPEVLATDVLGVSAVGRSSSAVHDLLVVRVSATASMRSSRATHNADKDENDDDDLRPKRKVSLCPVERQPPEPTSLRQDDQNSSSANPRLPKMLMKMMRNQKTEIERSAPSCEAAEQETRRAHS